MKNTAHSFVELTADQWNLYDEKSAPEAAIALNTRFNQEARNALLAQAHGTHLHEAAKKMHVRMRNELTMHDSLGGGEAGPHRVLEQQMAKVLGAHCLETLHKPIEGSSFLTRNAQEWDLYSDKPGAQEAAVAINQSFNDQITKAFVAMAEGMPRHEAARNLREAVEATMASIGGVGTSDTEPRAILSKEIERVLGKGCEEEPKAVRRPRPR